VFPVVTYFHSDSNYKHKFVVTTKTHYIRPLIRCVGVCLGMSHTCAVDVDADTAHGAYQRFCLMIVRYINVQLIIIIIIFIFPVLFPFNRSIFMELFLT